MRSRYLPATLPGKLVLSGAALVTFIGAAAVAAAFFMARADSAKSGVVAIGGSHYGGVPSPVTGAGLPVIIVGCGAYWLVRRHRRKSDAASS
jgi:hypothetical protein